MSSLSAKDRVSLCSFAFSDGRRCRTPRVGNHPHFKLLQLWPPAHLQLQPAPHKHPLPPPHRPQLPAILRVANDPTSITPPQPPTRPLPFPQPNSLRLPCQPLNPTTPRRRSHAVPDLAQTGMPLGFTSAIPGSVQTANSFRINTYKPSHKC